MTGDRAPGVVHRAADCWRRRRLARRVAAELARFRREPAAWAAYLAEAGATAVADGLD